MFDSRENSVDDHQLWVAAVMSHPGK
jgi:hypothetical protein